MCSKMWRCIGNHTVPLRQERVRVAEHGLIACRPLRIGPEKIRYPPCSKLAKEKDAIRNPQPFTDPGWTGLPEIPYAEN